MQSNHFSFPPLDSGAGQFSVSRSGLLAYLPGGLLPPIERAVLWVDRTGAEHPVPGCPPRPYSSVRLSPNGQWFAFLTIQSGDRNVWLSDVVRCSVSRLTDDGRSLGPVWAPDGKRIAFTTMHGSQSELNLKAVAGGSIDRLITRPNAAYAQSWMPDGSALAFTDANPQTLFDIWLLPLSGDRKPIKILASRFREQQPEFSPNGRWLAYTSTESGREEVFVMPYPDRGAGQPLSTGGGNSPAWSRDGTELFFTTLPTPDGMIEMMVVPVTTTGPTFVHGTPRALFKGRYNSNHLYRQYDISPDAKQFLMLRHMDRPPMKPTHMILVQNWFEELKRLVPTK